MIQLYENEPKVQNNLATTRVLNRNLKNTFLEKSVFSVLNLSWLVKFGVNNTLIHVELYISFKISKYNHSKSVCMTLSSIRTMSMTYLLSTLVVVFTLN